MSEPQKTETPSTFVIPPKLAGLLADYAEHHQTFGNKVTHYLGIPLIMLTLLGMLSLLVVGDGFTGSELIRLDGGTILWLLAMGWYLSLDWRLALPFGFVALGAYFIGRHLPFQVNLTVFILGWILQFIGHGVFEKKSPAFLTNLRHLLIGPLWIFARVIGVTR